MFGREPLDDLQARKQALLLESELNRLRFRAEWQRVRAATAWFSGAAQTYRDVRPWLVFLAPLAGLLAARRLRRPESPLGSLLRLMRWMTPLYSLWKGFASRFEKAEPETRAR